MSILSIVPTADGSKTIYNAEIGENYHSKHGALQESQHVFLNSGLRYFLAGTEITEVSVLEVGLGTGLNFLLTADFCTSKEIALTYTGIEAYPLSDEMIAQTGYHDYVPATIWQTFLDNYPLSLQQPVQLNTHVQLHTAHLQLLNYSTDQLFNIIYFDAFAALHQPAMWSEQAIAHTIKFLKPGGVFVTYAITGNLKRQLKAAGFKVEKAPGAPGKREMLRATKAL
ncbi:tRNA (5-methylaminomethyl-2-thiouridine)(34)-methyltransferase MnmD [Mucilaginibacter terrae]|uniref:tRNA (5-methylaminomethyl-2-thiouridine)(34)-methyltransferase MnmD n=1 Tax=Mucilaginibacter terrae TaxID=1955052 RepID=UPI00363EBBD3